MNWEDLDAWSSIYLSSEYLLTYAAIMIWIYAIILIIRMLMFIFNIVFTNEGFN